MLSPRKPPPKKKPFLVLRPRGEAKFPFCISQTLAKLNERWTLNPKKPKEARGAELGSPPATVVKPLAPVEGAAVDLRGWAGVEGLGLRAQCLGWCN